MKNLTEDLLHGIVRKRHGSRSFFLCLKTADGIR